MRCPGATGWYGDVLFWNLPKFALPGGAVSNHHTDLVARDGVVAWGVPVVLGTSLLRLYGVGLALRLSLLAVV